jgi:hypothetical protein
VDAERALADLAEISPQVEAALVFDASGPVGAVGVAQGRESLLAGAARELVRAAAESRRGGGGRVTQLRAALGASDVFVVGGAREDRGIVAVATGRPAPGLVFYDLKRCLAALGEDVDDAA